MTLLALRVVPVSFGSPIEYFDLVTVNITLRLNIVSAGREVSFISEYWFTGSVECEVWIRTECVKK